MTQTDEDEFIQNAFGKIPIHISEDKNIAKVKSLNNSIIKILSGGKSGASVFLCKDRKVLKLYPVRDLESIFSSKIKSADGSTDITQQKSIDYIRNKGNYDGDMNYFRSLRDILITNQLARLSPGLSPKVYDYGFLENVEVDAKEGKIDIASNTISTYTPYLIAEQIEGSELAKYEPTGDIKDIKVLKEIISALILKYTTIKDRTNGINIGCHRDLHPGNIFIIDNNDKISVKLIDFDLSVSNEPLITGDTSCSRRNLNFVSSYIGERIKGTIDYTGRSRLGISSKSRLKDRFIRSDADMYNYLSIYIFFEDKQKNDEIRTKLADLSKLAISDTSKNIDVKLRLMEKIESGLTTLISGYKSIVDTGGSGCRSKNSSRRRKKKAKVTRKNKSRRRRKRNKSTKRRKMP